VVQKKTFTKWVNSHLARVSCRISDLYKDLRDGRMLIKLLEVLSGEMLVRPSSSACTRPLPACGCCHQHLLRKGLGWSQASGFPWLARVSPWSSSRFQFS
jgi:hypothetical protein